MIKYAFNIEHPAEILPKGNTVSSVTNSLLAQRDRSALPFEHPEFQGYSITGSLPGAGIHSALRGVSPWLKTLSKFIRPYFGVAANNYGAQSDKPVSSAGIYGDAPTPYLAQAAQLSNLSRTMPGLGVNGLAALQAQLPTLLAEQNSSF